jgi:hypothetical protein
MYNTKVICTYNTNEIFLETDKINEADKNFIRDVIYRQELSNIFGIEEQNNLNEFDKAFHELYEKIKECKELKEFMILLSGHFMSSDEELGLMILYAYDYMYISHICVSEFLESGKISEDNIYKLKTLIY